MRKFPTILSSLLFVSPALAQHATSARLAQNTAQSPTSNQTVEIPRLKPCHRDTARISLNAAEGLVASARRRMRAADMAVLLHE